MRGARRTGRADGARRAVGAVGVAAIASLALAGCIPGPPPLPQATPAAPIVQGETTAGEVRQGRVGGDATTAVALQVEERSAVVIGAHSPDDEDLTLHLTGPGVDVENDDAYGEIDVFGFEMETRDSALAAVLDPGEYTIEVGEFGGDSTGFELQVLTGSTVVPPGSSAELQLEAGGAIIAMVPLASGDETLSATADGDTVMWAYLPETDTDYRDDDSGGDRNPSIELSGEQPQDIVVVVHGYSDDDSGSVQLRVE
ncbi:hypothetical protein [Agrococcus sp. ARC_14]|uniref:hypothetical protein n=1 Tax=Agrococcus sp. ARC_14 TaxID=2919927 RepID=UPI001F06615D|nr:hypothetical protein [Agrococcus sp. ARC_14]MCH1883997.1 hypothetical protein [Agrococcus sp. ARC_14]